MRGVILAHDRGRYFAYTDGRLDFGYGQWCDESVRFSVSKTHKTRDLKIGVFLFVVL